MQASAKALSLLLTVCIVLSTPVHSYDKDKVINIIRPDSDILFVNGGIIFELFHDHLEQHFPDFQFNYINMTYQKFWLQVNSGVDVCNMLGIPKPSDRHTILSKHSTFVLPMPSLIMLRENAITNNIPLTTNAFDILLDKNYIGAYTLGRRLHYSLDEKISEKLSDNKNSMVGGNFSPETLLNLIQRKRIDFFIGLPNIVGFINDNNKHDFIYFDFDEVPDSELRVVCADNDKNKRFIRAFDSKISLWYQQEKLIELKNYIYRGLPEQKWQQINQLLNSKKETENER